MGAQPTHSSGDSSWERWDRQAWPNGPGNKKRSRGRTGARRKQVSPGKRNLVFDRDKGRCVRCGANRPLTIDHIIPVSKGGTDDVDNLQTMCRPCNQEKADRIMASERLDAGTKVKVRGGTWPSGVVISPTQAAEEDPECFKLADDPSEFVWVRHHNGTIGGWLRHSLDVEAS